MKKIKLTHFIGRQLSRLRVGQVYYSVIMSTISTLGIVYLAFPDISIIILIILFPCVFIATFVVGYLIDVFNVASMDTLKTVEIGQRYLNTGDLKRMEFDILKMETIYEWLKALQEDKQIDQNILKEKLNKYIKKWSPQEKK